MIIHCYAVIFLALLGIIRIEGIASATHEKQFAAHLISDETEIFSSMNGRQIS